MAIDSLWKEKTFEIMCKLKELCDNNGITFMLYGDTAIQAYREHTLSDYATACIDIKDVEKLLKLIEESGDQDLAVESMLNNGKYPNFELRVYNPNTVDFSFLQFMKYKNNCLHVTVRIIEHVPSSKFDRRLTYLKYGFYKDNNRVKASEIDFAKQRKIKKAGIKLTQMRQKLSGEDNVSAKCFKMLLKKCSGDSSNVMVGNVKYPAKIFKKTVPIMVEDVEFQIPAKTRDFLAKMDGYGWETKELQDFVESSNRFRDATFSWEELKENLEGIDFEAYLKAQKEYKLARNKVREYSVKVNEYYNILSRTDTRFKLYQQYEPRKDEIMRLYNEGNFDQLREELSDYLEKLGEFAALDLGLCFDMDIFNAAVGLIRHDGNDEYADTLEQLVPDEHKKPLRIMDYKGNYIN
jgi:hypothetical protein